MSEFQQHTAATNAPAYGPQPPYQPAPTPPPRPKLPWVISLVAVLVAGIAGLFGFGVIPHPGSHAASQPAQFVIGGTIILEGTPFQDYLVDPDSQSCSGSGGYSDMTPGTAVTVADGQGHIVATGALGPGQQEDSGCVIIINVPGVPANLSEYVVTVSHRGSRVLTYAQAQQPLELTLGS